MLERDGGIPLSWIGPLDDLHNSAIRAAHVRRPRRGLNHRLGDLRLGLSGCLSLVGHRTSQGRKLVSPLLKNVRLEAREFRVCYALTPHLLQIDLPEQDGYSSPGQVSLHHRGFNFAGERETAVSAGVRDRQWASMGRPASKCRSHGLVDAREETAGLRQTTWRTHHRDGDIKIRRVGSNDMLARPALAGRAMRQSLEGLRADNVAEVPVLCRIASRR